MQEELTQGTATYGVPTGLRELIVEASRALARLDAGRLEELALSCRALNRDLSWKLEDGGSSRRGKVAQQAREAERDLAVLGRLLEATRANVAVMRRLRALRAGQRLEYSDPSSPSEISHGDN